MKQIIIATKNKGKVADFEVLFAPRGIQVKSLLDFEEDMDIEETGTTFKENAILKAEGISKLLNETVIADDSGLAVDALNGEPGVYSARYAGESKDDAANIEKVLHNLAGVPQDQRTARFHCALAIARPGKETLVVEGHCEGIIADKPAGEFGFGYDPIFFVPEEGKTMAQLSKEEKNKISHRAAAMRKMHEVMSEILEG